MELNQNPAGETPTLLDSVEMIASRNRMVFLLTLFACIASGGLVLASLNSFNRPVWHLGKHWPALRSTMKFGANSSVSALVGEPSSSAERLLGQPDWKVRDQLVYKVGKSEYLVLRLDELGNLQNHRVLSDW